jgi:hypothetical protein
MFKKLNFCRIQLGLRRKMLFLGLLKVLVVEAAGLLEHLRAVLDPQRGEGEAALVNIACIFCK